MADSRIASRYVKSLLGLAVEQKVLEQVNQDMKLIASTCAKSKDLVLMLKSPIIRHELKRTILTKIFKGKVHNLSMAIIDILTRKNREGLVPAIASQFHSAYNEFMGISRATVTTTIAMDQELRNEIEKIVKKLSSSDKIELEEKVNPGLIGGFVLNVGDRQIDASVQNKLKLLKVKFSENPYVREF